MVDGIKNVNLKYLNDRFTKLRDAKKNSGKSWEDFVFCCCVKEVSLE